MSFVKISTPSLHLLIIVAFSGLLLAPAFLLGAGGGDLHSYSLWMKFFNAQFWGGELYPRWLMGMFAGSGSPVLFYYPPVTFYFTALFASLAPLDPFGYYPIAASALLAAIISGVTFYLWMREEGAGGSAALAGSLLYIAAPNHLAQNFYYVMLLSSVWSYAWIPLLFLFARKVALRRPYAIAGFALALFLLIMTNLPMTLIFGPFAVAYGLLYFRKDTLSAQTIRMALAVLLGFALSAIYLLPALMYRGFANIDIMWWQGPHALYAPYSSQFLIMGFHTFNQAFYTLFWVATVAITFFYYKAAPQKPERLFFAFASMAGLIMILPVSQPLWELIPILKILQQPARFFCVPALCLALLAAFSWPRLRWLSCGLIAVYAVAIMITAWNTRTTMESFQAEEPKRFEWFMLDVDQYANYLTTPDLIERYYTTRGLAEVKAHRAEVEVLSGDAAVEVKHWKPRDILLYYHASTASTLRVRQFDFPGFRAFMGGHELDINRDEKTGQIVFDVPAGQGEIAVKLTALLPEEAGKMLSLVSAVITLLLVLTEIRRCQHHNKT